LDRHATHIWMTRKIRKDPHHSLVNDGFTYLIKNDFANISI